MGIASLGHATLPMQQSHPIAAVAKTVLFSDIASFSNEVGGSWRCLLLTHALGL